MKKSHDYNFSGGKTFRRMGASWYVAYCYYLAIDSNCGNWEFVSTSNMRKSLYICNVDMRDYWLGEVLKMDETRLNRNRIGLTGVMVKRMAYEVLAK